MARWDTTNPTTLREQRLDRIRAQTNVTPEIMAKQLEYQGRPFAVGWRDSHYSGVDRFETLAEAVTHMHRQWARTKEAVRTRRYQASDLWGSYLETPESRIALAYCLMADNVSSY